MRITYATLYKFASGGDSVADYILSQWDNEADQCYEDPEVGFLLYHVPPQSEMITEVAGKIYTGDAAIEMASQVGCGSVAEGSQFLASNTNGGDGYEDKN